MLKALGLLAVCGSVALFGVFGSEKMNFRKKYLSDILMFAENCTRLMQGENKSIFELFKKYQTKNTAFLGLITAEVISDGEALEKLLLQCGVYERDCELLCGFIQQLGTSDINGQTVLCKSYSTQLELSLREAGLEAETKGKMMRSLGLLAAAAIFIIFI